jgi:hypothetical protein
MLGPCPCAVATLVVVLISLLGATGAGATNYALQLNGNQWGTVPHHASLNFPTTPVGTIEFWVKLNAVSQDEHILGKRSGCAFGSDFYQFVTRSTNFFVNGRWGGSCGGNSGQLTPGQWYHFALTSDGVDARFFMNGVQVNTQGCGAGQPSNTGPLSIGRSGTCSPMRGQMDEVRIWNVARRPEEIFASHACSVDPLTPGLVGYWNFDEEPGDQNLFDLSPLENDGFLGNSLNPEAQDPVRIVATHPFCDPAGIHDASSIAPRLVFHSIQPNPAQDRVEIRLDVPTPGSVDLDLVTADGRIVRRLSGLSAPTGLRSFMWDVRSGDGSAMPSGIYFLRARFRGDNGVTQEGGGRLVLLAR